MFQRQIIEVSEGEEKKQEIENLLEKIMKENFPNLAKEIDIHASAGSSESPKRLDPRRNKPRHIIIKLPKTKDKERILKSSKGKGDSYLRRSSGNTIS